MPYRICKLIELESGHMLAKSRRNCQFPHGHTRQVEIVLEAMDLDANDMVCDFAILKEALGEIAAEFDHSMCVNTEDPMFDIFKKAYGDRVIPFDKTDPTSEVIARSIFRRIRAALIRYAARADDAAMPLSDKVRLLRVRVWETSSSWAEYEERTSV